MDTPRITTKDDQILNIDTIVRILTLRIENAIRNRILPENINDYIKIRNNCRIAAGRYHVFINIRSTNTTNLNSICESISKVLNSTSLYDRQSQKFSNTLIATKLVEPRNQSSRKRTKIIGVTSLRTRYKLQLHIIDQYAPIAPPKKSIPEILKPGGLNEHFLEFLVRDQLEQIKEIKSELGYLFPDAFKDSKFVLNLYDERKLRTIKIGPILSINTVGKLRVRGLQQKPDISISVPRKNVNISIKSNIFPEWSSAQSYEGAKSIFEHFQSNGIISYVDNKVLKVNGIVSNGIAVLATIGEVSKFCFNNKEIDYIIVNKFSTNDVVSKLTRINNNIYTLDVKCDKIYENSNQDIKDLRESVYLSIQKTNSKSSKMLPGFRINFVPENKLRGVRILEITSGISGRL